MTQPFQGYRRNNLLRHQVLSQLFPQLLKLGFHYGHFGKVGDVFAGTAHQTDNQHDQGQRADRLLFPRRHRLGPAVRRETIAEPAGVRPLRKVEDPYQ